ncbi:something about silencing protein 10 [Aethina tumida]|uniref:something about silencing protein 10 n=1 Tax=Aethina tumida TaxID=116153 RepID=UPI00096B08CC|nr:something about silencing protein 10 [Aethina tumida]
MPSNIKFNDADDYEPSDSDDDYTEKEKSLLKKVRTRKQKYSDSEEEVLGVGGDEESDDQSDIALSDVEGQDEGDDLPNERAWGKDRRKFYSTDYVDADYGGFDGKDAQMAELEEEEARNLQKQLAEQLDDDDFALDLFVKKTDEEKKHIEEVIKTDVTKLSKREKLQLLEKESPELFGLIEDFKVKLVIAKDFLQPVLNQYRQGKIPNCGAIDFVQTHYELILNYFTNINMYLLLKSKRVPVENHPIVKRLFQYRQLLMQLDSTYEEIIKPQIEVLLLEIEKDEIDEKKEKKTLNLLSKLSEIKTKTKKDENAKKKKAVQFADEQPSKKFKLDQPEENSDSDEDMEVGNDALEEDEASKEETENGKRAITYQMEKNKGLTPHRKKELRNPRVKNRQKFRKAVIRRKGAVREPRKELSRYGGEISGIKASVTKSIKIKS